VQASPTGEIEARSGAHKSVYAGNWKLQLEDTVDGYHAPYLHQTYFDVQRGRAQRGSTTVEGSSAVVKALGNGHTVLDRRSEFVDAGNQRLRRTPAGGEFLATLEAQVGTERARQILHEIAGANFNLAIYPNLVLIGMQIRTIRPLAVDQTEIWVQPVLLGGTPAALNSWRLRAHEQFYGPAGLAAPDDLEMFARVQDGLQVEAVEWVNLGRGLGRERVEDGVVVGEATDETPQRTQYQHWKWLLTAAAR